MTTGGAQHSAGKSGSGGSCSLINTLNYSTKTYKQRQLAPDGGRLDNAFLEG